MFSYAHILLVCCFIITAYGQNSCQTPEDIPGICTPIKKCAFIVDILQRERPVSNATRDKLKQYQCGVENQSPKVCCPHKNMNLFNQTQCAPVYNDKLIQGIVAFLFDYPWNVLIAYNTDNGKEFLCEGSLINANYVLTSAFCIKDLTQRFTLSHVRVGEHNLSTLIDCEDVNIPNESYCGPPAQDVRISELLYHPSYNSTSLVNNVGLIRLNKQLELSETLLPICLPFEVDNRSVDRIVLNGWGSNNFAPQSEVLLIDSYKIVPIEECRKIYSTVSPQIKIDNNVVCLQEKDIKNSGFTRCIGESGTSAYHARIDKYTIPKFVQDGIFSMGSKNCTNSKVPKVLTRVTPYLNWILDSVKP